MTDLDALQKGCEVVRLLSIWTMRHVALYKQHANAAPHDLLSHKKSDPMQDIPQKVP